MGSPLLFLTAGLVALSRKICPPSKTSMGKRRQVRLYQKGKNLGEVEVYGVGDLLYAPVEDLARWSGAGLSYYPASQEIFLRKGGREVDLRLYDESGRINDEPFHVPAPLLREGRPVVELASTLKALGVFYRDGSHRGFLAVGKRKREKGCGQPRMFSLGNHRFYLEVPQPLSPLRFREEEGCLRLYDNEVAVAEFGNCEHCGLGEFLVDDHHEGFFCRICCPHHPAVENLHRLAMSYVPRTAGAEL